VFDDAFTQAVWVRREMRGDTIIPSIVHLDLTDGAQRELVSADQLPVLPVYKTNSHGLSTINVRAFLPDGRVIWLDIATGDELTLSLTHEGWPCSIKSFSPDRRRVLAVCSRPTGEENVYDRKTLVMSPHDTATIIDWAEEGVLAESWIDDDRLILTKGNTVSTAAADGSSRRQVFPPKNRADWPAVMRP
jgi:hypothetical protein